MWIGSIGNLEIAYLQRTLWILRNKIGIKGRNKSHSFEKKELADKR